MLLAASPLAGQVCAKHIEVPEYPVVARAGDWKGVVNLTVQIGAKGQVVKVDAMGAPPILIDHAKENVKQWLFCSPQSGNTDAIKLRFDYRIEGTPTYPSPHAKVVIDLAEGTVVIRTALPEMQP